MTKNELTRYRTAMGLSQQEFADLLEVDTNTVSRWEQGQTQIPRPMAKLVKLTAEKELRDRPFSVALP